MTSHLHEPPLPHGYRTFAVGDVHGCDIALEVLIDQIHPEPADHLIFLGDVIDRGPDSRRVVQMLIDIGKSCWLDLVMGNHEQMLFDALSAPEIAADWLNWGGSQTLQSYGGRLDDIPDVHLDFLEDGLPYVETERDICVHAGLEPDVPLSEQSVDWLRWRKVTGREVPHESGKRIICGHTQMPGHIPHVIDGWVMIDTSACHGGFLTAVDLDTGEILQSRQNGEFRDGVYLEELR